MKNRTIIFLACITLLSFFSACSTVDEEQQLKKIRKEFSAEDMKMEEEEEADIDDDLNPVERKAVDKIFKEDALDRERSDKEIFSEN